MNQADSPGDNTADREEGSPQSRPWGHMGLPVWKVVYVASGWNEAERIKNRLSGDGLLVMLRTCGNENDRLAKHVELLVPELEVTEAHSIIMQLMGAVRA